MPKGNTIVGAYPQFRPTRTTHHPVLGRVIVFDHNRPPRITADGSQASFYRNNAEIDNPFQFGIKIFNTSIEAFAAYQRQKIAAQQGLAPPVGSMVRWIVPASYMRDGKIAFSNRKVNRWGYETAVAKTDKHSTYKASLLACPKFLGDFFHWSKQRGYDCRLSRKAVQEYMDFVEFNYNEGMIDYSSFDLVSNDYTEDSLMYRLSKINICGTQYDNIANAVGDNAKWKSNPRLRLGQTYDIPDKAYMSGDLHRGNIGLWRGCPVCVDFGYHLASPDYKSHYAHIND